MTELAWLVGIVAATVQIIGVGIVIGAFATKRHLGYLEKRRLHIGHLQRVIERLKKGD